MPMAGELTLGKIATVKISDSSGYVLLTQDGATISDWFLLWHERSPTDDFPTPQHLAELSLVLEAIRGDLRMGFMHEEHSPYPTQVVLWPG
jgi:hypothetical protein